MLISLYQNDFRTYFVCIIDLMYGIHVHCVNTKLILIIITRCAYAQGRVKRLSPSIYLFVCLCVVKKHGCLLSYRSKIATK